MLPSIETLLVSLTLSSLCCANHSSRSYGTFERPAARARPRFRYWLPDASVDPAVVQADIQSAAALGIGGVEFLPFYNYGGGTPVVDWVEYGFGTPAFNALFQAALEAHRDSGLYMDFAMGPNQGQGVPAETDNPGLQWDLRTHSVSAPQDTQFKQIIPGWGTGDLVAVVSAFVLSSENLTIPPRAGQGPPYNYTRLVLQHDSLTDCTESVSLDTGSFSIHLPSANASGGYRIFAFYETLTLAKNLDPQTNATGTMFDNGCFIVDHFDARGARVVTDFWDQHILIDGIKALLSEAGNSAWEDSMELLSNVSWSPSLPARFERQLGYSLKQYLPLIIFGNNNRNIQSAEPGLIQSVLDTEDEGQGFVNDYRIALTDGYQEFLSTFVNWSHSELDLQYSSQVSYNLPMDMEASIPYDDVPECESLQYRDNVDSYRQFSGPAFLAGKTAVSIELGAVFGDAYTYTLPHLLWASNRAASGGVNQYIIHGQQYSGNYPQTTWPGYVSFGYHVSDQYSSKQPDWENGLESALRYMGRIMYVQQQGIPRTDVAFYNRQSATDPIVHTLYELEDLQDGGWTYAYLSPSNFALPQAHVADGVLAPDGPAYKAIVVESSQNMTLEGANALLDYAAAGLPIIVSGGSPGVYRQGAMSDEPEIEQKMVQLLAAPQVFSVEEGGIADQLRTLGVLPRIAVETNGTWFPSWREDEQSGIDYAYVFCDMNASSGSITVPSTRNPFLLNAWTGDVVPLAVYEQDAYSTTIPLSLAGNETVTIAFAESFPGCQISPARLHVVDLTTPILGYSYSESGDLSLHVPTAASESTATLSNGSSVVIDGSDVPPATALMGWTLVAEHWAAPADFNDSSIIADKYNTTHELDGLISWLDIPSLANVSGIGYYSTNFTWSPSDPAGAELGAYISFSKILHAVTVYVNGQRLTPLDSNHAEKEISAFLLPGRNEVLAVVPTTMWNYLQTLLPRIEDSGAPVEFAGGAFGSPSAPADNGLVGVVDIIPYKTLSLG